MRNSAAVIIPGTNVNSSTHSSSMAAAATSTSTTPYHLSQEQAGRASQPKSQNQTKQQQVALSCQVPTSLKLPMNTAASHSGQQPLPMSQGQQPLQYQQKQQQQILAHQRAFPSETMQLQHFQGKVGGQNPTGNSVLMGPLTNSRGDTNTIQQPTKHPNSSTTTGAEIRKQQTEADKEREALYQNFVHHQLMASNAANYQILSVTPTKMATSIPHDAAAFQKSGQKGKGLASNNGNQSQNLGANNTQQHHYTAQGIAELNQTGPLSLSTQQFSYGSKQQSQMGFDQHMQFTKNSTINNVSNAGNSSTSVNKYTSVAQQQAAFLTAQQQQAQSQLKVAKQNCPLAINGQHTQNKTGEFKQQYLSHNLSSQQQSQIKSTLNSGIANNIHQLQEYEATNQLNNGKGNYQVGSSLVSSPAKFQIKQRVAYKPKRKKTTGIPNMPTAGTNKNVNTGTNTRMVVSDPTPAYHSNQNGAQNNTQIYTYKKNPDDKKVYELQIHSMHSQSIDHAQTTNSQSQYQQESNLDTFTAVATSSSSLIQQPNSSGSERQQNTNNSSINNKNAVQDAAKYSNQQANNIQPPISTQSTNQHADLNLKNNTSQAGANHLQQYSNLQQQRAKQKTSYLQKPPQSNIYEPQQHTQTNNFVIAGSVTSSSNLRQHTAQNQEHFFDKNGQLVHQAQMNSPFQVKQNISIPLSQVADPAAFSITINEQDDDVLSPQRSNKNPIQQHITYQQQQKQATYLASQHKIDQNENLEVNPDRSPQKINTSNQKQNMNKVTSPKSGLPGGASMANSKMRSKKHVFAGSRAQSSHGHRISDQNRLEMPTSGKITSNLIVQNAIVANETTKTHSNQFISDSEIASLIVQQAHVQVNSRRKLPGRNLPVQNSINAKRPESELNSPQQPNQQLALQYQQIPNNQSQGQQSQVDKNQIQIRSQNGNHQAQAGQIKTGSIFYPQAQVQASASSITEKLNLEDQIQPHIDKILNLKKDIQLTSQKESQNTNIQQLNIKSQLQNDKQGHLINNNLHYRSLEEAAIAEDEEDHYNFKGSRYQNEKPSQGSKTLEQNATVVSRHKKNSTFLVTIDESTRKSGQQSAILPMQTPQVQQSKQMHGNLVTPLQAQSYKGQFRNSMTGYEQMQQQTNYKQPQYYDTYQGASQLHQLSQQNFQDVVNNFAQHNNLNKQNVNQNRPRTSMKSLQNDGPMLLTSQQQNGMHTISASVSACLAPSMSQQVVNYLNQPNKANGVTTFGAGGASQQMCYESWQQHKPNQITSFTNNSSSVNLNGNNNNYESSQYSIEKVKLQGQNFTSPITSSANPNSAKLGSQNTPILSQQQVQYLQLPSNTKPHLSVNIKGNQLTSTQTHLVDQASSSDCQIEREKYQSQHQIGENVNLVDNRYQEQRHYLQSDGTFTLETPAQNRDDLLQNVQLKATTPQQHRLSQRLQFNRRYSHHTRPLLIIQFQGVLGDFLPNKSDKDNFPSASHSIKDQNQTSDLSMTINIRVGALDGLKILSQYFQVVIFSRETLWDGWPTAHGSSQKVIFDKQNMLVAEFFKGHPEIRIDGLYVSCVPPATAVQQFICWEDFSQIYEDFEIYPSSSNNHNGLRTAQVGDINSAYNWCSEKVLHITPVQNQDLCMFPPQPVTTQNLNLKNQGSSSTAAAVAHGQIDPQGYFMFDFEVQPPVPLINTVPLITESTKEETSRIDLPPVLVVPNFRLQHARIQLNFMQIARTVMILAILGQKTEKIEQKVWQWTTLREMDFKVQKNMISLQLPNPSSVKHIKQTPIQQIEANSRLDKKLPLKQRVQSGVRREVVINKGQINRGKHSGHELNQNQGRTQTPEKQKNNDYNNCQHGPISNTAEKSKNTPVVHVTNQVKKTSITRQDSNYISEHVNQELPQQLKFNDKYDFVLNNQFFAAISWKTASNYLNKMQPNDQRSILGLHTAESDLIWRFYKQKIQDQMDINDKLDRRRVLEEKALEEMLSQSTFITDKDSVQEIFAILQKRDTLDNPLTSMMARNLRFFAKLQLQSRKRLRKALEEWRKFVLSKQKENVLDSQQISRFIVMGCDYPNQFYQIQQGPKCERHDLVALKQKMKEAEAAHGAFEALTDVKPQFDCRSATLPPFHGFKDRLTQRKQQHQEDYQMDNS